MSLNLKANLIASELFGIEYEEVAIELLSNDAFATLLQEDERTWIGSNLIGVLQAERIARKNDLDELSTSLYVNGNCIPCDLYDIIDSQLRSEAVHSVPLLMGYLSYELLHTLERVSHTKRVFPTSIPTAYFALYRTVYEITKDHRVYRHIVEWTLDGRLLKSLPNERRATINAASSSDYGSESIIERLDAGGPLDDIFASNFTRPAFIEAVKDIKREIRKGEYYQINLSQQLKFPLTTTRETIIRRAAQFRSASRKAIIQACFFNSLCTPASMDYYDALIVSISPELFFEMHHDQLLCAPIKGTRKRSPDPAEDRRLLEELLHSTKDDAELSMIVDLVRNDLSRICAVGSVEVLNHRATSTLTHVHHTFSTVTGSRLPDARSKEIISALYPCGSITGAPKIAAMRDIASLEGVERGPYCGAIGYWGANGSAHFNVAIRTATIFNAPLQGHDLVVVNSGGGITLNSDEESEYVETLHKLKSILSLLCER
jgi:para-aminobenzoate synthetase component 1